MKQIYKELVQRVRYHPELDLVKVVNQKFSMPKKPFKDQYVTTTVKAAAKEPTVNAKTLSKYLLDVCNGLEGKLQCNSFVSLPYYYDECLIGVLLGDRALVLGKGTFNEGSIGTYTIQQDCKVTVNPSAKKQWPPHSDVSFLGSQRDSQTETYSVYAVSQILVYPNSNLARMSCDSIHDWVTLSELQHEGFSLWDTYK